MIGGGSDELTPEVLYCHLQIGDAVLLCTDGLTMHVNDPWIAETICSEKSSEIAASQLVKMANDEGGKDNITVILAKFTENKPPKSDSMEQEVDVPSSIADTLPMGVHAADVATAVVEKHS